MPDLSILIPTVATRKAVLSRLLARIGMSYNDRVEVVVAEDNFELTVGAKRNKLLAAAEGKWTTFVDDDDMVHKSYCELVLDAIDRCDDAVQVGYKLKMLNNGRYVGKPTFHSLEKCKKPEWYEDATGYYRPVTHLNPMRAEISKKFKFPEISMGEDRGWAKQILDSGLITKEIFVDKFLYVYCFNANLSASLKGAKAKSHNLPVFEHTVPVRRI